uniref:Uncharacterized protein n=1 Tax=Caenorhabditis japonica TaxID=281687 RepID=A0A8R1E704_CAEJA
MNGTNATNREEFTLKELEVAWILANFHIEHKRREQARRRRDRANKYKKRKVQNVQKKSKNDLATLALNNNVSIPAFRGERPNPGNSTAIFSRKPNIQRLEENQESIPVVNYLNATTTLQPTAIHSEHTPMQQQNVEDRLQELNSTLGWIAELEVITGRSSGVFSSTQIRDHFFILKHQYNYQNKPHAIINHQNNL